MHDNMPDIGETVKTAKSKILFTLQVNRLVSPMPAMLAEAVKSKGQRIGLVYLLSKRYYEHQSVPISCAFPPQLYAGHSPEHRQRQCKQ